MKPKTLSFVTLIQNHGIFPQHIIYIFKGLFKQSYISLIKITF